MTEDDVRRIIREEIDRARYLAPIQIKPTAPMRPERPTYEPIYSMPMPLRWNNPSTCGAYVIEGWDDIDSGTQI